ncbi:MAG: alpha,alpha-trehalase ath1 [Geoglossum umbratile]|nr:MAG: alpha,alpha-trehalase ath1 [Geoglossum umbratile]
MKMRGCFVPLALAFAALLLWSGPVSAQQADFTKPWASNDTHYNVDTMTIWTTKLIQSQFQARIPLANGYAGISSAAEGPFFAADRNLTDSSGPLPTEGWPLFDPRQSFATIAGFWDEQANTTKTNFPELLKNGGESVISGIPHWSDLVFTTGDGESYVAGVDSKTVTNFNSSLNMKDAIATWTLTWTPDKISFNLSYQLFLSHAEGRESVAAVRLDIVPSEDHNGTVTDILDGRSAVRSSSAAKQFEPNDNSSTPANVIWTAVKPNGLDDVIAYVYAALDFTSGTVDQGSRENGQEKPYISTDASTIAQQFDVSLKKRETTTVIKYVGIASSDGFPKTADTVARTAALYGKNAGWDNLLAESKAAWSKKFNEHVLEDYRDSKGDLPEYWAGLHIATVAQNFYLLQNLPSPNSGPNRNDRSISVGGLTSDSYAGFVFWDADLFMSPAILATKPEYAQSIGRYRVSLLPQAKKNAASHGLSNTSAIYPWTSSRYGNCTATGPCFDYQYHLNGDIVLNLFNTFLATGNMTFLQYEALPVMTSVSSMFEEVLQFNKTTNLYEMKNMTDPDEYANQIDNGAFTMGLIGYVFNTTQQVLQLLGMPTMASWTQIVGKLDIPRDDSAGITMEYDTMNSSLVVKQADVVLLSYPVGSVSNSSEALRDLDWYAQAQSADGPAMTFANYMISAAELSPSGCSALTYSFTAFEPYVRGPFYQFSEQQDDNFQTNGGTNPAFPFLTGSGGFSQVAPYGFLGYRPKLEGFYVAPWTVPHLEQVKIRDIVYMGATFRPVMNATHTTITRIATQSPYLVDANPNGAVPIIDGNSPNKPSYPLSIGQSVTIKNRNTHTIKTIPGNLLQCLPVTSDSPTTPGQTASSAIDGANSTKWQPLTPAPAALTVDLGSPHHRATALFFNWAQTPPLSFAVSSSTASAAGPFTDLYADRNVSISNPPADEDIFDIEPRQANVTYVRFGSPVEVGRWVRLVVAGTKGPLAMKGATVAEFALVGAEEEGA